MRLTGSIIAGCALAALIVPGPGRADDMATEERVVPESRLAANVDLHDVRTGGDAVSGTVVNRSPYPVRDVRLVVSHVWVWDNEFHPGTDDYSRADYYVVPGEIPPGGSVPFTIRPSNPLSEERGGRYLTKVAIARVVEIMPGASPTAGTRGVEPRRLEEEPGTTGVVPAPRIRDEGTRAPAPRPLEEENPAD